MAPKAQSESSEDAIIKYIRSHNLRPGDKLPPEREFAALLHLSRLSLRDGLNALQVAGVIYRKHGSGTFVAQQSIRHLLEVSRAVGPLGLSPEEVVEARLTVEPAIVALAARKANDEDMRQMEISLQVMIRECEATGTFSARHDREFHEAMARGAHNPLLESTLNYLYSIDENSSWGHVRNAVLSDQNTVTEFLREHQQMFDAIRGRKPAIAYRVVNEHIERMANLVDAQLRQGTKTPELL